MISFKAFKWSDMLRSVSHKTFWPQNFICANSLGFSIFNKPVHSLSKRRFIAAQEMTQVSKILVAQAQGPEFVSPASVHRSCRVTWMSNCFWGSQHRQIPAAHWLVCLDKWMNSKFSESLCLKDRVERNWRSHRRSSLHTHAHTCAQAGIYYAHIEWTCTYIHKEVNVSSLLKEVYYLNITNSVKYKFLHLLIFLVFYPQSSA